MGTAASQGSVRAVPRSAPPIGEATSAAAATPHRAEGLLRPRFDAVEALDAVYGPWRCARVLLLPARCGHLLGLLRRLHFGKAFKVRDLAFAHLEHEITVLSQPVIVVQPRNVGQIDFKLDSARVRRERTLVEKVGEQLDGKAEEHDAEEEVLEAEPDDDRQDNDDGGDLWECGDARLGRVGKVWEHGCESHATRKSVVIVVVVVTVQQGHLVLARCASRMALRAPRRIVAEILTIITGHVAVAAPTSTSACPSRGRDLPARVVTLVVIAFYSAVGFAYCQTRTRFAVAPAAASTCTCTAGTAVTVTARRTAQTHART